MRYIAELRDGDHVIDYYLVKDKQMLLTKANKEYLKLSLEDKTGSMNAMVWELSNVISAFEKADVVQVDAKVALYNGDLQMTVARIRKAKPTEYDASEFFRTSKEKPEDIYQRLLALMQQVRDPGLRQLLAHFFVDDAQLIARLKAHPAAKSVHHGYMGGLLEHSVSVTTIALSFRNQYPDLNPDLLIAGGLLHDIGKLYELNPLPLGDYSDAGNLLGHISIGYQMVHDAAIQIPEMTPEKRLLLEHMILSHHGELDFGSPVVPKTREAMALHLADLADSKMKQVAEAIEMDHTDGNWTGYNRPLERYIYKPLADFGEEDE